MGRPLKLLIIDDSEIDAALITGKLTQNGFDIKSVRVDAPDVLKEQLGFTAWDIIVCDYIMPSFSVMEALAIVSEAKVTTPFIVLTSMSNSEIAPDLIKAGASDFVTKDELSKLVAAVEREVGRAAKEGRETENREEKNLLPASSTDNKQLFMTIKKKFAVAFICIAVMTIIFSFVIILKGTGDFRVLVLLSGLAVFGALVFSWRLLTADILKPIGAIKKAAERIAVGDLSEEMEIKKHDEIGRLAYSFEEMRKNLNETFKKLKTEISDRYVAEQALQVLHLKLTNWVSELDKRTHEITILNKMGKMLQSCKTIDEFHSMTMRYAEQLFPDDHGAVYLFNDSGKFMEAVCMWGKESIEHGFSPDDCWSLRRGHLYSVEAPENLNMLCKHVNTRDMDTKFIQTVCVPMTAQGETIGMFHLRSEKVDTEPDNITAKRKFAKEQLVIAVAEHITLALSNLKLQKTLLQQSIHDPLTGLFNRRHMKDSLEREIYRAKRHNLSFGVIMLDIDHFKKFNDEYGHDVGDLVLEKIGQLVKKSVRPEEIPCRYGGEEFLIILPGDNIEDANYCAKRLLEETRKIKIKYKDTLMGGITISLGVAAYPANGNTGDKVVKAADTAMLDAKNGGRNCIVLCGKIADESEEKSL